MVKRVIEIHWSDEARLDLKDLYYYIKKDSIEAAKKVKKEIFSSSIKLKDNPMMFEADRFKIDNDGSFRVYHVYDYRISYRIKDDIIRILRVTHSSLEPREY